MKRLELALAIATVLLVSACRPADTWLVAGTISWTLDLTASEVERMVASCGTPDPNSRIDPFSPARRAGISYQVAHRDEADKIATCFRALPGAKVTLVSKVVHSKFDTSE